MALHEVQLRGYSVRPGNLSLGTFGSYGIEQLHVTIDDTWSGLAVTATFNPPKGEPREIRLPENGLIDVPAEATANEGTGTIVYCGVANGVQRITKTQGYNVITRGNVGGTAPFKPSESLATQVLQAALNAEKNSAEAKSVADNLRNDAANGKFNGKDGAKGDKGETGDKGDTGAKGDKGNKGFSPTAAVTQLENGAEIAITDEKGTTKAIIKNGSKGDKGDRGSDGVSPTVSVEDIENGHRVTIVDANGTASVDIYNGEDGIDGKDGVQIDDAAVSEDAPWSSKHIIDMLCPKIEESGNPVQCYPVAGYPLGVTASWEPMQEGSGDPHPAGGGKNAIPFPSNSTSYPQSRNGLTVEAKDGAYIVNGTATADTYFSVCNLAIGGFEDFGNFALSGCPAGGSTTSTYYLALYTGEKWYADIGAGIVGQLNTIGSGARIEITIKAGYTANGLTFRPQLEKGTTATAWAPYENIRPIKGRDSVTVERCGENVIELLSTEDSSSGIKIAVDAEKNITLNGTLAEKSNITIGTCRLHWVAGKTYTMYIKKVGGNATLGSGDGITFAYSLFTAGFEHYFRGDTTGTNLDAYIASNVALVETELVFMLQCWRVGTVFNNFKFQIAVVPGTIAPTTYTPYNGQTDTLTLPETVYGGEVDAVTGDGNNNTKIITLDGNELKFSQSSIYFNLPMHSAPGILARGIICCSHFDSKRFGVNTNYEFCFVLASDIADLFANVDDLNAYLAAQYAAGTPVQIAYKLAEPVPFTATGGTALPALAGANTVLTDADSATVTGRADPVKRITDLEDAVASQT